jgi:membrane-associated protease RseP (regulator of RpoE activity)
LPLGVQASLMRAGIAILLGLTMFLIVADVMRLFNG